MFAKERQQKIYDLICRHKSMKVAELSSLLDISEVTIRRDLEELHNQSLIIRTHGGAISKYPVASEISAMELISSNKCIEEKRIIAEKAYSYIKENDTVITDGSSTVYELIKLIATRKKKKLLIITTSLLTVSTLSSCSGIKVIMIGGEVNYRHNHVEGYISKEIIKMLRADKCFIGVNGIDEKFGYSTPRFEDAEAKTLMMGSCMESFILADSTKFEKTYLTRINAECNYLITDKRQPEYDYGWLAERTNLIFADTSDKLAEVE